MSEFIGIINYCIMALIQIDLGIAENPDIDAERAVALYKEKADRCKQLMMDKNHDYGEAWREMRVSSLTDLILQKLNCERVYCPSVTWANHRQIYSSHQIPYS